MTVPVSTLPREMLRLVLLVTLAFGSIVYGTPSDLTVSGALQVFQDSLIKLDRVEFQRECAFLKQHYTEALQSGSKVHMRDLEFLQLVRQPWKTEEIEVFYAVRAWLMTHPKVTATFRSALLNSIRFEAMHFEQLTDTVSLSGLVPSDRLEQALRSKKLITNETSFERFENQLARRNVLSDVEIPTTVTEGSCHPALFIRDADFCRVNATTNLVFHTAAGYTINNFRANIHDQISEIRVEVASDRSDWTTVFVGNSTSLNVTMKPLSVRHYRLSVKTTLPLVKLDAFSASYV